MYGVSSYIWNYDPFVWPSLDDVPPGFTEPLSMGWVMLTRSSDYKQVGADWLAGEVPGRAIYVHPGEVRTLSHR
jgi:hypothetical protein